MTLSRPLRASVSERFLVLPRYARKITAESYGVESDVVRISKIRVRSSSDRMTMTSQVVERSRAIIARFHSAQTSMIVASYSKRKYFRLCRSVRIRRCSSVSPSFDVRLNVLTYALGGYRVSRSSSSFFFFSSSFLFLSHVHVCKGLFRPGGRSLIEIPSSSWSTHRALARKSSDVT